MRIICLEEHCSDADVSAATATASAELARFARGIGTRVQEDPSERSDRPRLVGSDHAMALAAEPVHRRIPAMDAAGIDVHVVSLSDSTQFAPPARAAALARAANDRLAAAAAAHPDRVSAFFTLPWQDPDAAIAEARRCVHDLGLPATLITGRPDRSVLLDDARYGDLLAELAALQAPLYVHPGPPLPDVQAPYYGGFDEELSGRLSLFGWGWHNEAGIQVVRLILSGALERNPGLRLISGHWGEMVPFFLQRMDDAMPREVTGLGRSITDTYREQVFVTPSGMLYLPHFQFVREVLGADRIMFSVDYPFLTMGGARRWLEALPVPAAEREAIAHGNAEALLRLPPM